MSLIVLDLAQGHAPEDAVMYMDHDQPLLTVGTVRAWEARLAELGDSIRAQQEEVATLTRKIEAAKVLMEALHMSDAESAFDPSELRAQDDTAAPEESISHAVLAAVSAMKGAPKAAAIRAWINTHNPAVGAKLEESPAYLYTTLMRHVRGGRLAKRGKGYRLPQSSPKGETGGVAPPVDSIASPLQTSAPLPAAAEAGGT